MYHIQKSVHMYHSTISAFVSVSDRPEAYVATTSVDVHLTPPDRLHMQQNVDNIILKYH